LGAPKLAKTTPAGEFFHGAMIGCAELHAAMGATVEQDVDFAVAPADGDDLARAELASLEVAWVGDFRFETDVQPIVRAENALGLAGEDVGVGVDPVGDARGALLRPCACVSHRLWG
jgi:hypothetical protein